MNSLNCNQWKYYNHAAIPSTAPHEEVDNRPIEDNSIWEMKGSPIFARWTTNFDCGYETSWWWVIKETPYIYDDLSSKTRKHIKQALKKCIVKKINFNDEIDALWKVYVAAYKKYRLADNKLDQEQFYANADNMSKLDCWAAYDSESNEMIGWMTCDVFEEYVSMVTAKYDADNLNKRASDAIHNAVCDYYLNKLGKKYISAGERSINHITQSQEYKISTFKFRKAYCTLNIKYKRWLKIAVKLLYPFRRIIEGRNFSFLHKISTVLKMEELIRANKM